MINILIVEDEASISNLIKINLDVAGYSTRQAYDGEEALDIISENKIDLILLDVMIPKIDGFELIQKIKHMNIPVIFLTAKDSLIDKVTGLRLGAEDYIVKPFEAIELLARIEVVLRRYGNNDNIIKFKNISILLNDRVVKINDKVVDLTLKEFELFVLLLKNKNVALTREGILQKVWGYEYYGETRTVDNHIQKIRSKLNLNDNIKTVYKVGYRLED
ncbi:response regulator transcription factor [Tepidibacter hydrothermalis]|uniref:Stage 0 sporulation protein A homolog n=1 Tax=Tepidibacter hydrothermalis TaxID=3036126 RepID=A0ABY8EAQ1_9FIRM|nr:response regulator transcription factor [Tepidibacter hydrothermalis]WFD10013.1 response regulator transcription factor [Tepidibacter hydrothermalis]